MVHSPALVRCILLEAEDFRAAVARAAEIETNNSWVTFRSLAGNLMEKMETIKPGMTRWDLLKVFRAEGGPPTRPAMGLRRSTFVSQDSPYFKIDVEFESVARPDLGSAVGFSAEDNRDVILKVSKPYVQFATTN
jgi:hypothetical protein